VRHVPTYVAVNGDRYYAVVNSLTNSTYAVVWHPVEFSDVAKHWAKDSINDMGSRMIVEGTEDGLYHPDRNVTRAEFAAILVRGLGLRLDGGASPFSDVHATDWHSSAVNTAQRYGLIHGYGDGTFRPKDYVTREQAMAIIARAMNLTNLSVALPEQPAEELLSSFADLSEVSAWAYAGAVDSVQAGIVQGRSHSVLAPKAHVTRAEAATMVQRLLQKSQLID
jgi:hypothetical protein